LPLNDYDNDSLHSGVSLLDRILSEYTLDIYGIHGLDHWFRVVDYGLMLGKQNTANLKVVALFGLLHDSKRQNDSLDNRHGIRAAQYARSLAQRDLIDVTTVELDVLYEACAGHTSGQVHDDVTIGTCWDADRLDLHRFAWKIDCQRLSTAEATNFVTQEAPSFIEPFFDDDEDRLWQDISSRRLAPYIGLYL
jgi:uncharacterized protein